MKASRMTTGESLLLPPEKMRISEVFGLDYEDKSPESMQERRKKHCPFRDTACTKSSKVDPLGVCSLSNGLLATALCPVRFLEGDRVFVDAANIAFGPGVQFAVFPEIRILKIPGQEGQDRKIGKVDFLIGKIVDGGVTDFAAVEVQAVYFSGRSIRPMFNSYLSGQDLSAADVIRRPDFRSSAQKRLMPQLMLKVPVFRRWGKKFLVVVDSLFLQSLPKFPAASRANSELTWLSYPISKREAGGYTLGSPEVIPTLWEDVASALREGKPPEPAEIIDELQQKLDVSGSRRPKLLIS